MEAVLLELTRVIAERDMLAAQIKADALTLSDRIQHATKHGNNSTQSCESGQDSLSQTS